ARVLVTRDRVEHRQVERERLARGGAARDDHVALTGRGERLYLVRVQALDAGRAQGLGEGRVELGRKLNQLRVARVLDARLDQAPVVRAELEQPLPGARRRLAEGISEGIARGLRHRPGQR